MENKPVKKEGMFRSRRDLDWYVIARMDDDVSKKKNIGAVSLWDIHISSMGPIRQLLRSGVRTYIFPCFSF